MKASIRWIKENIRGISCFGFGIQWEPKTQEENSIRMLLVSLEDKRFLHIDEHGINKLTYSHIKQPEWLKESVLKTREQISQCMRESDFPDEVTKTLQDMRVACREFLEDRGKIHMIEGATPVTVFSLGIIRKALGLGIAKLAVSYNLEVSKELMGLLKVISTKQNAHNK